jgi:hypothetical protein
MGHLKVHCGDMSYVVRGNRNTVFVLCVLERLFFCIFSSGLTPPPRLQSITTVVIRSLLLLLPRVLQSVLLSTQLWLNL